VCTQRRRTTNQETRVRLCVAQSLVVVLLPHPKMPKSNYAYLFFAQ